MSSGTAARHTQPSAPGTQMSSTQPARTDSPKVPPTGTAGYDPAGPLQTPTPDRWMPACWCLGAGPERAFTCLALAPQGPVPKQGLELCPCHQLQTEREARKEVPLERAHLPSALTGPRLCDALLG